MGAEGRGRQSELLDLSASYGGTGLQTLAAAADEELLGSFAGIAAALISFCRNTEIPAYIRIAEALERTEDIDADTGCATIDGVKEAYERTEWLRGSLSEEESSTATEQVKGSRVVETPSAYDPERPDPASEPVALPNALAPQRLHHCTLQARMRHL